MEIIRGTTPTLKYSFDTIEVTDIARGYLVAKVKDHILIEKPLTDAVIGDTVNFTLSQEETLKLPCCAEVTFCFDWVTSGGTRGRSKITKFTVSSSGKEEVI